MSDTHKDKKLRETRRTARQQRAIKTGIPCGGPPISSEEAQEDRYYHNLYETTPEYGKRDRRHSAALRKGACDSRKRMKRHDKHSANQKAVREIERDSNE